MFVTVLKWALPAIVGAAAGAMFSDETKRAVREAKKAVWKDVGRHTKGPSEAARKFVREDVLGRAPKTTDAKSDKNGKDEQRAKPR